MAAIDFEKLYEDVCDHCSETLTAGSQEELSRTCNKACWFKKYETVFKDMEDDLK